MCNDNSGYFVFLYNVQSEITTLAGSVQSLSIYAEMFDYEEKAVSLPKAFMLGSVFQGTVFYDKVGKPILACIPIASRPLAL